ncbi:MAG: hypothetical protein JNM28_08120 [Armatimonadetes bacterium]|nr:hypothetical protein [Armatimonadota bacterium]
MTITSIILAITFQPALQERGGGSNPILMRGGELIQHISQLDPESQQRYRSDLASAQALIKLGNGVDAEHLMWNWRSFWPKEPDILETIFQIELLKRPYHDLSIWANAYQNIYVEAHQNKQFDSIHIKLKMQYAFAGSSTGSVQLDYFGFNGYEHYFDLPESKSWNLSRKYIAADPEDATESPDRETLRRNGTVVMCGMYSSNPYIVIALIEKQMAVEGIERGQVIALFGKDQALTLLAGRAYEAIHDTASALRNYHIAAKGTDPDFAKEAADAIIRLQR